MSTRLRAQTPHSKLMAACAIVFCIILVAAHFPSALAYPSGPGAAACAAGASSQKPAHPGAFQTSAAPFALTLTDGGSSYKPGQPLSVVISSTDGGVFIGFMVSAFREGDTAGATRLGSFAAAGAVTTRCAGQAAAHATAARQTSVTVQWTPPATATGSVILQATVLRAFTTYWKLPPLTLTEWVEPTPAPDPEPTPTPTPTPTPEPTPTPSTPVSSSTGAASPVPPASAVPPANPTDLMVIDADVGTDGRSALTLRFSSPASQQGIASYLLEMRSNALADPAHPPDDNDHDDDDRDDDDDDDKRERRRDRDGRRRGEDGPAPARLAAETPFSAVRSIPAVAGQASYDAQAAGLEPATSYTFRVRASNDAFGFGTEASAPTVTITTSSLSAALPSAPTAPSTAILSALPNGALLVDMRPFISAGANTPALLGYELQWKASSTAAYTSQPLFVPMSKSSAEISGAAATASAAKNVRVRVRAKSMRGDSPWSADMSMDPSAPTPTEPSVIISACPNDCSGRGNCALPDGVCDCGAGWLGPDCSTASQLALQSNGAAGASGRCFNQFCLDFGFDGLDRAAVHFRLSVPGPGWAGLLFDASDGMSGGDGFYFARFPGATSADAGLTAAAAIRAAAKAAPSELPQGEADSGVISSAASFANATHTVFLFRKSVAARPALRLGAKGPQRVSFAFGASADFVQHRDADCGRLLVDWETGTVAATAQPRLERVYAGLVAAAGCALLLGLVFSRLDGPRFSPLGNAALQKRVGTWTGTGARGGGGGWLSVLSLDAVSVAQDLLWGEAAVMALYAAGVAAFIAMGYEEFPRAGLPGIFTWGHLAAAHWCLVLLPVSKNSAWAWLVGSSFERLVRFHRWLGRAALAATYAHLATMLYEFGGAVITDQTKGKLGVCALSFFTLAAAVGFEPIRRVYWRIFIAVHVGASIVGFVFVCLHVKYAWWFLIAPLSLWLIDVALRCVIRPFLLYRVTVIDARAIDPNGDCDVGALVPVATAHFVADDLELEGDGEGDGLRGGKALAMEMTTVKSSKAVGASGSGSGSGGASSGGSSSVSSIGCHISRLTLDVAGFPHDFEPGSYCFLNIPKCSLYQFHPFSISNYPTVTSDSASAAPSATRLTFHILAGERSDSWTRRLYSELQSGGGARLRVRVDGPYGRLQVDLRRYGVVLLVAGGIGITPLLSVLLYLNDRVSSGDSAFCGLRAVHLMWACRGAGAFSGWAGDALRQVKSGPHADKFHLHLFVDSNDAVLPPVAQSDAAGTAPPPPMPQADLPIQPGRPNLAELMESVASFAAATSLDELPPHHAARQSGVRAHGVALLACGPAPLVADAQREAAARGFHFHKETFAL